MFTALYISEVLLTCCDTWHTVARQYPPDRCPRCQCRLKWAVDPTPCGESPHVLSYLPPHKVCP